MYIYIYIYTLNRHKFDYYSVLEKGHGAREKGHGAREKGHGVVPC